ncbi:hypothetical protein SAMD00019534_032240 [Acytostelium subglobosum LB1]|uniref:hypothetical protein n=1 Tax=Acytostelium subglobosum LB1 TaxID=1410327 RepID=UPI0006447F3B|nr:hypothetical protein SAMD00019534_032240 [Acytostelium subglobosum LB1]GAM20049.1 hypothetical protein SAMD00019534_032240 [Acytostelium subglobosum LB1]|eukprot:XP_012756811.1 hypothetical protein SAMD00019534_032240 [Acytostelium subglobosum LB1]
MTILTSLSNYLLQHIVTFLHDEIDRICLFLTCRQFLSQLNSAYPSPFIPRIEREDEHEYQLYLQLNEWWHPDQAPSSTLYLAKNTPVLPSAGLDYMSSDAFGYVCHYYPNLLANLVILSKPLRFSLLEHVQTIECSHAPRKVVKDLDVYLPCWGEPCQVSELYIQQEYFAIRPQLQGESDIGTQLRTCGGIDDYPVAFELLQLLKLVETLSILDRQQGSCIRLRLIDSLSNIVLIVRITKSKENGTVSVKHGLLEVIPQPYQTLMEVIASQHIDIDTYTYTYIDNMLIILTDQEKKQRIMN